ncbi:hypothetical protein DFA_02620 [Cavenderia fasciculata]|uniref:Rho-GAP domain-containing protein n=1 Tax=Cavenderia fasciculata TaxID=261658 RepID=F4PZW7_CACFS|nr:uncharacterized protein DFA_02620 [Cavenderia fasciculata]EGG18881.1 hypothetical protein DFA_02620 [Cavenderia fasciculata]|eukprot:XP_004357343.1 hypothetical protein DFA_02620 [Cavenderia fasciculata]
MTIVQRLKMKNIFRRSVQIFHKKDKEEPGGGGGEPSKEHSKKDSSRGGDSPHGSKKDKKSKRNSRSYTDSDGISPNNSISSSSSKTTPTATSITTMFSPPTSPPLSSSEGIPIGYNNGASGDGRRVFGVALADVPCRGGSRVPIIVEKLVDHLERTSLSTEGLFRIPGRDVTILECVRLPARVCAAVDQPSCDVAVFERRRQEEAGRYGGAGEDASARASAAAVSL